MSKLLRNIMNNVKEDEILDQVSTVIPKTSFVNKIVSLVSTYKKTAVVSVCALIIAYYIKRKYGNLIYDMYNLRSELNKIFEMEKINDEFSLINKFDNKFNNLIPKILSHIDKQIQCIFSVNSTYNHITSPSAEVKELRTSKDTEYLWSIFKNKIFISLIVSITLSRTVFFLSQTHIVLLEKFKQNSNDRFKVPFYEKILNELWNFVTKFIEFQIKSFENKLNKKCDEYNIRLKMNKEELKSTLLNLRDIVEGISFNNVNVEYDIMKLYLREIEVRIEEFEALNLTSDIVNFDEVNKNTYGFITFFRLYYDVCSSTMFTSMLYKLLEGDYNVLFSMIDANYNNSNDLILSMPKMISFLFHIKTQILQNEHSLFLLSNPEIQEVRKDLNIYFDSIFN